MLPSTDGAKSRRLHLIGDNFICGNAFDVTDSHIMRMEKEDSGVKNMAEWWARAFELCRATLSAKMGLA